MRKLIFLLMILLPGCGYESREVAEKPVTVLKRSETSYALYLFDGESAEWYMTDAYVYGKYLIGDTLQVTVLTLSKEKQKCDD